MHTRGLTHIILPIPIYIERETHTFDKKLVKKYRSVVESRLGCTRFYVDAKAKCISSDSLT
jgi:hypothetical protein